MFPRPTRWIVLTALVALFGFGQMASAQSVDGPRDGLRLPPIVGINSPISQVTEVTPIRPRAMLPLYSTLIGLQVADAALTMQGLNAGARELNPLMRNSTSMTLTKVATMATTIVIAERMWKRNKPAAIAALVAANVVSGVIVARNARIVSAAGH